MSFKYYARLLGCENACDHCAQAAEVEVAHMAAGWMPILKVGADWPRTELLYRWTRMIGTAIEISNGQKTITKEDMLLNILYHQSDPNIPEGAEIIQEDGFYFSTYKD